MGGKLTDTLMMKGIYDSVDQKRHAYEDRDRRRCRRPYDSDPIAMALDESSNLYVLEQDFSVVRRFMWARMAKATPLAFKGLAGTWSALRGAAEKEQHRQH